MARGVRSRSRSKPSLPPFQLESPVPRRGTCISASSGYSTMGPSFVHDVWVFWDGLLSNFDADRLCCAEVPTLLGSRQYAVGTVSRPEPQPARSATALMRARV